MTGVEDRVTVKAKGMGCGSRSRDTGSRPQRKTTSTYSTSIPKNRRNSKAHLQHRRSSTARKTQTSLDKLCLRLLRTVLLPNSSSGMNVWHIWVKKI